MKARSGIKAVIVFLAILALIPVGADSSAIGLIEFSCTMDIPVWPKSFGPGLVACEGASRGLLTGQRSNGSFFSAAAINSPLEAHFDMYHSGACPVMYGNYRFFSGSLEIRRLTTLAGEARLDAEDGSWLGVGAVLIMQYSPASVTLPGGAVAEGTLGGVGVASFLPISVPTPTCSSPGPLRAAVTGLLMFA